MIAKAMEPFVFGDPGIGAMFDVVAKMVAEYGEENVYNFSIGNPSEPAPEEVKEAIKAILDEEPMKRIHGYNASSSGDAGARAAVAEHLNRLHGTAFTADNIMMTVGAAGGLNVLFKTILDPGTEVITFAPYFGDYNYYVENSGGTLKVVAPNAPTFQPDAAAMEELINENTRAVIINSPNNPTGVIYREQSLKEIGEVLARKSAEYGHAIFLVADEPYRELAYDGKVVPYATKYYDNTIVAYSYSKSLSLPGDRIGYLVFPNEIEQFDAMKKAAECAIRMLGFINAPSLIQLAVEKCVDASTNIAAYDRNRKALYEGLKGLGYDCVYPDGAFYLWMKTPVEDDGEFAQMALKHRIVVVPGKAFGCPGYVRVAYCVPFEMIGNSMPAFKDLMTEIQDNY